MNEIAGGAAILIDPTDEVDAARRIAEGLLDRDAYATRGAANAERFTEDRMLEDYASLYRKLLGRE